MKGYNPLKNIANPTIKTQEKILELLRLSNSPLSLTELSKKTNLSFYQVRTSIKFLQELGVINVMRSDNGTTLCQLNNKGEGENVKSS